MKLLFKSKHILFFIPLISFYALNAQVGVGTTTPAYTFQVVNNGNIGATFLSESTNSGTEGIALSGYNDSATNGFNAIEGATNGTFSAVFGLSLPVAGSGIGVYGVSNSPDGVGILGIAPANVATLGFGGEFVGGVGADAYYVVSDSRTKRDIQDINNALEKIMGLKGYTYKYDFNQFNPEKANDNAVHYGFMAQNVKEQLPHAVAEKIVRFPSDKQERHSNIGSAITTETLNLVNYNAIVPVLVQAMKEQQIIINNQEKELELLKSRLSRIEENLNNLREED